VHIRVVIAASLAGILFGFDTAVIVDITRAPCEISPPRSRAHGEARRTGADAAPLGVDPIMADGAASARLLPPFIVFIMFIASFAIAQCAVIWLFFPMSEACDVAPERIDDPLCARRHGTAQYAHSIVVGMVVCAIKDKENI
jgi:hypothetical protein